MQTLDNTGLVMRIAILAQVFIEAKRRGKKLTFAKRQQTIKQMEFILKKGACRNINEVIELTQFYIV